MHPTDLPEELLQSIKHAWHLSSDEEALAVAGQLMMYVKAIVAYVRTHPKQVREQLARLEAGRPV